MKRERKQVELGRKARRIRGKDTRSPVLRAVTTNEDGDEVELNTQKEMVPAIAESTKVRQQQCIIDANQG